MEESGFRRETGEGTSKSNSPSSAPAGRSATAATGISGFTTFLLKKFLLSDLHE